MEKSQHDKFMPYHEAGHTIVLKEQGYKVTRVRADPKGFGSQTEPDYGGKYPSDFDKLVCLYAGEEATLEFIGKSSWFCSSDDLGKAELLLDSWCGNLGEFIDAAADRIEAYEDINTAIKQEEAVYDTMRSYLEQRARNKAREIIRNNRAAVEHLAQTLRDHVELTEDQVREILSPS